MKIAIVRILAWGSLLLACDASAVQGVPTCKLEGRGSTNDKIVTFTVAGRVYAINGTARTQAASHGWLDGKDQFKPDEMQRILQEGSMRCEKSNDASFDSAAKPTVSRVIASSSETAAQTRLSPEGLRSAIEAGDIGTVKRYVDTRYPLNQRISGLFTSSPPVSIAAAGGQCAVLQLLIDAGADPDPSSIKVGFTPLSYAANKGSAECVRALIARHVRLDVRTEPGGDTALIMAAYSGHLEVVKLLQAAGASLTASNKDHDTAFRAATVSGHEAVASYLQSKGGR